MINTGCGCLSLIFGFLALLFLFKFWLIVILFLLFFLLPYKEFKNAIKRKFFFIKKEEYMSKPGIIYKECSYCHKKSERNAPTCSNCGRSFEEIIV